MNIVLVGNLRPSHSSENHFMRSFQALGHTVTPLQEDEWGQWPADVGSPDLLVYVRTWDCVPLERLREVARGAPMVGWHLDIWMGLDRAREVDTQVMFRLDAIMQPDGDALGWFAERGVNARWLRPGVVADECFDAEPFSREEVPWDVAFVGSRSYHAEWPHRPALIDWLAETYGERFIHVGGDGTPILGRQPGEALRGGDLNRFYATVPVIVGDSLGSDNPARRYVSDRFFETWGRGGFLVFPELDFLRNEVGPYPSYRPGDPNWREQLRDVIENCLAHDDARSSERQRIAAAVRAGSTYTQRAAELLDAMGLQQPLALAPPLPPPSAVQAAQETGPDVPYGVQTGLVGAWGPDPRFAPQGPPATPRVLPAAAGGVVAGDASNPASFAPPVRTSTPFGEMERIGPDALVVSAEVAIRDEVARRIETLGPLQAGDVVMVRMPRQERREIETAPQIGPDGLAVAEALQALMADGIGSVVVASDAAEVSVQLIRESSRRREIPE